MGLVIAAFLLVGTEVLALGAFGAKAWANIYLSPPAANAIPVQVQAGQFAFYFRYPGPTESSVHFTPTRSTKRTRISSGWIRLTIRIQRTTLSPPKWRSP